MTITTTTSSSSTSNNATTLNTTPNKKAAGDEEDSLGLEDFIRRLKKRAHDLDWREQDLNRREALLQQALGGATPSDVLHLNVGGRTDICVLRRTLTCMDNSMLAAKFSGRWDDNLEKDRHGNIFIDADPDLFLQLLSFLRKKCIWEQGYGYNPYTTATTRYPNTTTNHHQYAWQQPRRRPPSPPPPSPDFDALLEYYHLPILEFYPIEVTPCYDEAPPIEYEILCAHEETQQYKNYNNPFDNATTSSSHALPYLFSITSPRFMSFSLNSVGHNRIVSSFTVVFGRFSQLRIGWYSPSRTTSVGSSGIGHYSYSCALDVGNNLILCEGGSSSIAAPTINHNNGTLPSSSSLKIPGTAAVNNHKLSNQEGTMVQFQQYRTRNTGCHTFWSWKVVGTQSQGDFGGYGGGDHQPTTGSGEGVTQNSGRKYTDPTPCISLQGHVKIADIEYEECV
ncbi:hypothetical protein ACA910_018762 [Epithemia clementina (nom. ined.)]